MAEERDFVMARVAAARAYASGITSLIDEYLVFAVDPDPEEDPNGVPRKEILEQILDDAGHLSRAVEAAQDVDYDPKEGEPEIPQGDGFDEETETE